MNTITINDTTTTIPTSWNTMTLRQQLGVYGLLLTGAGLSLPPDELIEAQKISVLQFLTGLNSEIFDQWQQSCIDEYGEEDGPTIFYSEVAEVTGLLDWLFTRVSEPGKPYRYRLSYTLTRCPWPEIRDGDRTFYAPADGLENITIYEMGLAFHTFEQFVEKQDADLLHRLLAILYRPPKEATTANLMSDYEGDIRLPLLKHESTIPARAEVMARLPAPTKKLILFWFASCREQILGSFPNLFSQPTDQPAGERVGNDYGWGGLLLTLADGLVHLDTVARQSYSNALTYLSYLEDQRKLTEMRMKRKK